MMSIFGRTVTSQEAVVVIDAPEEILEIAEIYERMFGVRMDEMRQAKRVEAVRQPSGGRKWRWG